MIVYLGMVAKIGLKVVQGIHVGFLGSITAAIFYKLGAIILEVVCLSF